MNELATLEDILGGDLSRRRRITCPFPCHDDSTPSAMVYEDGHVYCFGCGGRASSLVDLVRQVMFADSTHSWMAAQAYIEQHGVLLPAKRRTVTARREAPGYVYAAMAVFVELARDHLANTPRVAEQVARERGVDPGELGLAEQWQLRMVRHRLRELGYDQEAVNEAVRLALLSEGPSWPLGSRLIVPVTQEGRVIYYQARSRGQSQPKYLNPRQVPRPLQGIDSLAEPGPVIVAEGIFDVLPLQQAGMPAVAALGAMPTGQLVVGLARRLEGREVAVVFDNDETGRVRGGELAERLGGVLLHPPSRFKDLGEWLAAEGAASVMEELTWRMP